MQLQELATHLRYIKTNHLKETSSKPTNAKQKHSQYSSMKKQQLYIHLVELTMYLTTFPHRRIIVHNKWQLQILSMSLPSSSQ